MVYYRTYHRVCIEVNIYFFTTLDWTKTCSLIKTRNICSPNIPVERFVKKQNSIVFFGTHDVKRYQMYGEDTLYTHVRLHKRKRESRRRE